MLRYLLSKFGQALFVLWAAFTATFMVLQVIPGDPVTRMMRAQIGGELTTEQLSQIEQLKDQLGYNDPLIVQYLSQVLRALRGDLGVSIRSGEPVTELIARELPSTLQLAGSALALGLTMAVMLSLVTVISRSQAIRTTLSNLPALGVSVPTFWIGLLLLQVFSFTIPLFPATGSQGRFALVLPSVTLAIPTAAMVAQILMKSMTGVLREPYIETALSKGASRSRVVFRHTLRNAAIPAVTMLGVLIGGLLSGSLVTEIVFSRRGLGRITLNAIVDLDIPVVQGVVLLSAFVFAVVNLLVDLTYPILDPRLGRSLRVMSTPRSDMTGTA